MKKDRDNRLVKTNYPLHYKHRLIFSDVDAFGHINNGAIGRFFEEGRAALRLQALNVDDFQSPAQRQQMEGMLVNINIDYLAGANYPGNIEVYSAIDDIGRSSWKVVQAAYQGDICFALCDAVLVNVENQRSKAIPDSDKNALRKYHFTG